ncbi:ORF02R [Marbled eel polyomavirus]|uniref:ORF02R n=1 Tax=Marbled eel polyomavirus TaxID=1662286 RepID=UPI0007C18E8F|nr:ORF02R [Marbled eel polyomavirus]ANC70191.1 ORF02R [Marbled eel polyomavirus]
MGPLLGKNNPYQAVIDRCKQRFKHITKPSLPMRTLKSHKLYKHVVIILFITACHSTLHIPHTSQCSLYNIVFAPGIKQQKTMNSAVCVQSLTQKVLKQRWNLRWQSLFRCWLRCPSCRL